MGASAYCVCLAMRPWLRTVDHDGSTESKGTWSSCWAGLALSTTGTVIQAGNAYSTERADEVNAQVGADADVTSGT